MDSFPSNRSWMYDRTYSGRRGLKRYFVEGVEEFVSKARQQDNYIGDRGIRCPCVKCNFTKILRDEIVKVHLYKVGFVPNYWIWTDHGEKMLNVEVGDNFTGASSNVVDVDKVFHQTHIQKDIGQFNDGISRRSHENFETTLSQATSKVASYKEERLKSQGLIEDVNIKKRRRTNDTHGYRCGDNNLMDSIQTCSKRSHVSNEIALLRQEVSALREEIKQCSKNESALLRQEVSVLREEIKQFKCWFQSLDLKNIWKQQQQQQKDEQQQPQVAGQPPSA